MALGGGALGALLAWWGVKAFVATRPSTVPRIDLIAVDLRVLAFATVVSIVVGIAFGLAPALRAASVDLLTSLKDAARGTRWRRPPHALGAGGRRGGARARAARRRRADDSQLRGADGHRSRLRPVTRRHDARIASERALSAARPLVRVPPRAASPRGRHPLGRSGRAEQQHSARRRRRRVGGSLRRAAAAELAERRGDDVPLPGGVAGLLPRDGDRGRPRPRRSRSATRADSLLVAVVEEALVEKFFPNADPIGKRIAFEFTGHGPDREPIWREVIGVVRHVRHYGLVREPANLQVYAPLEQLPVWFVNRRPTMTLFARTPLEPEQLAASIRQAVSGIDRDVPVFQVQTMEQYVAQATEQSRLNMTLLGAVRRACARAGGPRHLRRAVVLRQPPHAGNRHPDGARRDASRRDAPDRRLRDEARRSPVWP